MLECWHALAMRVLHNCIAFSDLTHHQAAIDLLTLLFAADLKFDTAALQVK
jgi:hypothetical protein